MPPAPRSLTSSGHGCRTPPAPITWSPVGPTPATPTRSARSRLTVRLLWLTEIEIDYRSGASSKPHDMEVGYPARMPGANSISVLSPRAARAAQLKEAASDAAAPQVRARAAPAVPSAVALTSKQYAPPPNVTPESGEETLDLNGRRINTHWQSITYPMARTTNGTVTVKVWSSDEVPGHLVRKTEDRVTPADATHAPQRVILETYLESIEGFAPEPPAPALPRPWTPISSRPRPSSPRQRFAVVTPVPPVVPTPAVPAPRRPRNANCSSRQWCV